MALGPLSPLCALDSARLNYAARLSHGKAWRDIPACTSAGIPARHLMLRGIFAAPSIKPEQVAFYRDLLAPVRATPEWAEFMARGAPDVALIGLRRRWV